MAGWHDRARSAALVALALGLVSACGQGRAPTVDVLPPPDTPDTGGPYQVTAIIQAQSVITRAAVRWFVGDDQAAAQPLPMVHEDGTDRWTAEIPGQPAGAVVQFTVEVDDDEGHEVIRPAAATDGGNAPTYRFNVLGSAGG